MAEEYSERNAHLCDKCPLQGLESFNTALQHASRLWLSCLVQSCGAPEHNLLLHVTKTQSKEEDGGRESFPLPRKKPGATPELRWRRQEAQRRLGLLNGTERGDQTLSGGAPGRAREGDSGRKVQGGNGNRRDGLRRAPGGRGNKVASSPSGICPCLWEHPRTRERAAGPPPRFRDDVPNAARPRQHRPSHFSYAALARQARPSRRNLSE